MKTASVSLLMIATCLLVLPSSVMAQQPLTDILKETELRDDIQLWKNAREAYYRVWYRRRFSISVEKEAGDFLIGQYTVRKVPIDLLKDRQVARAVIRTDMETVLNRSQFEAMIRQQGAPIWFLAKGLSELVINRGDVQRALQAEDCNVIPCPPDKCDPDTCAKRSFQRFTMPRPTPAR